MIRSSYRRRTPHRATAGPLGGLHPSMNDEIKIALLTNVLRTFGLPDQAIGELVSYVEDLYAEAEPATDSPEPFRLREHFLSAAEHRLYLVLREATQGWAQIYPKVGLGSLFYAACGGYSQYLADTHRINYNHVDFLLCRPDSLRPALGIMLDAQRERSAGRRQADGFVAAVFAAAGLPLIHIPVQHAYNAQELAEQLSREAKLSRLDAGAQSAAAPPCCPRCGSEMELGVERGGILVWMCTNFPCCRAVQPYEPAARRARA